MANEYRSRVDWWLALLLPLPAVGAIAAIVTGITKGGATLWIGIGAAVGYAALLGLLVLPIRYSIDGEGFHLRAGVQRLHVPWERLLAAELSSNILSSPALSWRRIRLDYRKPNGRETFVLISPPDREAFLRDLAAQSPAHQLVDGRVVPRSKG